ncbi:hypothetical protein MO867_12685 [Microbulbifer sp. OS29]|uniref:Scaffolding protein n=1 Tax=Microbulbifer okhotskensis TaxID=2926617 RepID=A0A9X2J693_9GAMM|nr:hypothetical protein [Microbulbifer okhotskensis]MCO1335189.1 hypothetical protein [Microbulbifer okhotskensis]
MSDSSNNAIDEAISGVLGEMEDSEEQPETETENPEVTETDLDTETEEETEASDSEEEQPETEEESEEGSEETTEEAGSTEESAVDVDGEKVSLIQVKAWRDAEKNFQAGYTKKYQKLADTQKQADQKYQQLDQNLQFLENQLKGPLAQFDSVNWQQLQASDPAKYQQLHGQYKVALQGFQQVEEARKKLKEQTEGQRKADHQRKAKEAVEALQGMHSDWSNELYHSVLKYAVEKGVPQEEIASETRPWVISALLNQMKAEKAQVKPKPKPQTLKRTTKQKVALKRVDPKVKSKAEMSALRKRALKGDAKAEAFLMDKVLQDAGAY